VCKGDCTALTFSTDVVESFWVRIRGTENKINFIVSVYY